MIPKIIHYCWFGGNPKSELIQNCIASWRKYCPDWEIIEWNESNWDIEQYAFAKEAHEAGKWAFVSDVARLDVLCKLGGVYLDTDVELLYSDPFSRYLDNESVVCFDNARGINTGLFFAAEKGSILCTRLLEPYKTAHYSKKNQLINTVMNRPVFVALFPELRWNAQTQILPVNGKTTYIMGCEEYGQLMKHYGTRSWCDNLPAYTVSKDNKLKRFLRNPALYERMERSAVGRKILPVYTFLSYDLLDLGPFFYLKLFYNNHLKSRGAR